MAIADLAGDAPVYTLFVEPDKITPELRRRTVHTSFLQYFPPLRRRFRLALPLMPWAAGRMNLTEYDVVLCSDAAVAKGMRCRTDALKVCYCHSPIRYVWDLYDQYRREAGWLGGAILAAIAPHIREWDRRAAATVTAFIANSHTVCDRISRHYGRRSVVIYPPVDMASAAAHDEPEDFYLVVSELVGYKRTDLAIEACNRLGRRLVVIGEGPQMPRLRAMAGEHIRLLGYQSDEVVRDHMRRCRGLLFCGEEDFGLVPVEVQSSGRPVIAFGRGGACETVLEDRTGIFFLEQTPEGVVDAVRRFEDRSGHLLPPEDIRRHASQFGPDRFRAGMTAFLNWCMAEFDRGGAQGVASAVETLPVDAFLNPPSTDE